MSQFRMGRTLVRDPMSKIIYPEATISFDQLFSRCEWKWDEQLVRAQVAI